jgi:hypothetical protein
MTKTHTREERFLFLAEDEPHTRIIPKKRRSFPEEWDTTTLANWASCCAPVVVCVLDYYRKLGRDPFMMKTCRATGGKCWRDDSLAVLEKKMLHMFKKQEA